MSELSVILNFTILHSISLFCTGEIALFTNLGLIDMFSANQIAEIVACILLGLKSYAWFQNRTSAQCKFDLNLQV